jgi:hypothetical protein
MYIQHAGFSIVASFRVYSFDVIDPPAPAREFTVKVGSEEFGADRLKFQDGPGISYARLQRELEGETQASRAEAHLRIETGTSGSTGHTTIHPQSSVRQRTRRRAFPPDHRRPTSISRTAGIGPWDLHGFPSPKKSRHCSHTNSETLWTR